MNKKQKIFLACLILVAVIAVSAVALTMKTPSSSNKLEVVTSFYPLTYLSQEIGGDQIQVTQLIPNNTEIHSWEPSASSIVAAEDADIVIYSGTRADHWMEDDVLSALSNAKTRTLVKSTAGLELIANQEEEPEPGEEHSTYDPHIWMSPYMAKLQAENIYTALVQVDPEHESYYTQRWQTLENKLDQLDNEYLTGLSNATKNTIFVTHEAFGYLAYRYGFEQHGVIGLSADEQPSTTTIATLVDEMEEYQIYVVYVDPVYSTEYAETIQSEVQAQTGHSVTILKLYLMLGPTDNIDFLQQMQTNLANLKIGLEAT